MNIPMDERLVTLRNAVEYVYGARVDGDLIEFGVQSGYTAAALINSMLYFQNTYGQTSKKIWLCDSFQGFPVANHPIDTESPMVQNKAWGAGCSRGCSAEMISSALAAYLQPDQFVVLPGWFRDTQYRFASMDRKYSLIHADCDLYSSTMDALRPLFYTGCVSDGCIVLFDDWNGNMANPRFGQRKSWSDLKEEFAIEYSDEGPYGAYSHKFIIHSYQGSA